MSLLVTLNGANYIIPQTNEVGWGSNLDDYFVAIAAGVLQKTGGTFTLSAETDFGSSYGLKSLYYKSRASNVAATGAIRLANAETGIVWRNFLNNADLALTVNASNQLSFNGVPIQPNTLTSAHILVGNGSNIATDVAMTGDISIDNTGLTAIGAGKIVNAQINASAAIARSKLAALTASRAMATDASGFDTVSATTAVELGYVSGVTSAIQTQLDAKQTTTLTSGNILVGNVSNVAASVAMSGDITITNAGVTAIGAGKIVNAQVNAAAAIAYSKLNLTGSIVNADVNASAAIAYSKLNLALSIVNADVSTSAAIAYSKLNLTGSIVNADVNASAAIAYSKLALTGSIVNADISSSAAIAITKVAIGTANQIIGTNNGATANEFKTLTATANQVSVTHGAGTVTFATPQDIGTASAVRFGSLTLGGALDASSILSLISTTKGFLPPVMTTTQKNAISTPTDGLIVYDSSLAQLFLRAASAWTPLSVGGGSGTVASGTQYQIGYYATSTNTISGNSVITTDASGNLNCLGLFATAQSTIVTASGESKLTIQANAASQSATLALKANNATAGQCTIYMGDASGATKGEINYDPTNNILSLFTNSGERARILAAGNLLVNTTSLSGYSSINPIIEARQTSIATTNAGDGTVALYGNSAFAADTGAALVLGQVYSSGGALAAGARISSAKENSTDGNYASYMSLATRANGGNVTERVRIDSAGQVGINMVPGLFLDVEKGVDVTGGQFMSVIRGKSTAAQIADKPGIILGYNNAGTAGIVAAATQATGTGLQFWTFNGAAWGARQSISSAGLSTFSGNIAFSATSTQGIVGTTTNDSAAAGNVGQTISSFVTVANFPTSTQQGDLTSISLTAGDWLISVNVTAFAGGATVTDARFGVSVTTGNSTTGLQLGDNQALLQNMTASQSSSGCIAFYRASLTTTTVHYLKYGATYTGGPPNCEGRITALRIR